MHSRFLPCAVERTGDRTHNQLTVVTFPIWHHPLLPLIIVRIENRTQGVGIYIYIAKKKFKLTY